MKSYIKIYGPPMMKALKALEKLAIDFPEVCIMSSRIEAGLPGYVDDVPATDIGLSSVSGIMSYFGGPETITEERCNSIISKSGESLGEYDFFYEWFQEPTMEQLTTLIEKIDEALAKVGVKYTITTK
jgi:hypothetical protein